MKILAISDVVRWEGYEKIVDEIKPDVIVLAGNLTSDGFACFWCSEWFEENIPGFLKEERELMRKFGNKWNADLLNSLKEKYVNTKKFHETRKKLHVNRFYQFLKHAGKKSQVLVIRGNHDEDFEGDYVPERINKIRECKEISGKIVNTCGMRFLGLGFNETHYLRILKSLINACKGKVDIVIMHGENILAVSSIKPKLIIRGGYVTGKYLVNGVPSFWNSWRVYTVINLENKEIREISQYDVNRGTEVSWSLPKLQVQRYKWLKPYPI
ncbi:MAG: metallophosphoesterase [Thermoproteota archaeon]